MSGNAPAIRAWIVATLTAALDGAAPVFDHEVYCERESELRRCYLPAHVPPGERRLNGWHVRRAEAAWDRFGGSGLWRVKTTWLLRGFMAMAAEQPASGPGGEATPASEILFDAQIDAVCAAFRPAIRAARAAGILDRADRVAADRRETRRAAFDGPQLDESAPVMFAGALCHHARLLLVTTHNEQETTEA